MRVPRTAGRPWRTSGSIVIRSSKDMVTSYRTCLHNGQDATVVGGRRGTTPVLVLLGNGRTEPDPANAIAPIAAIGTRRTVDAHLRHLRGHRADPAAGHQPCDLGTAHRIGQNPAIAGVSAARRSDPLLDTYQSCDVWLVAQAQRDESRNGRPHDDSRRASTVAPTIPEQHLGAPDASAEASSRVERVNSDVHGRWTTKNVTVDPRVGVIGRTLIAEVPLAPGPGRS